MSNARAMSFVCLAAAALVAGCATAGAEHTLTSPGGSAEPASISRPRAMAWKTSKNFETALTSDDLADSPYHDAYSLVRAVRPDWLMTRGKGSILLREEVRVYRDGVLYGGPSALRDILTESIERIERLSGAEATQYFGTNNTSGVISIVTRGE